MVAVALISAFIAMRLAIHGREAVVPNLAGLTVNAASDLAARQGLNLALENRFYSDGIAPGRILAQDPPPGSRVRREWPVRITESLGAQRVNIPDLTGQSERAATVNIRRLSLDLGAVAHLAVPGDAGVVLTQTPPVNSAGVDGPRISLLVSDSESEDDSTQRPAYVMPSLIGLSYGNAAARAAAAGLHVVPTEAPPPPATAAAAPAPQGSWQALEQMNLLGHTQPPAAAHPFEIVTAQSPQPGRRVVQGDTIHIGLGQPAAPTTSTFPTMP
jgi:beta-lactam-binding protein with PASTA domain